MTYVFVTGGFIFILPSSFYQSDIGTRTHIHIEWEEIVFVTEELIVLF